MTPRLARIARRLALPALVALSLAACGQAPDGRRAPAPGAAQMDPARVELALSEAAAKQQSGQRLWCVPFARTLSGVGLTGDARTWWAKAEGTYARGTQPRVGAVMAFKASRQMRSGHVAVVSQVVSEREVRLDHANWDRNEVSLSQRAVDVSHANDWSEVRVESIPGTLGRVNPVAGFIYPGGRG